MGITIVVVDHHPGPVDLALRPNVQVIRGKTREEFYANSRPYVNKTFDLVVTDQDPDGVTSVLVYGHSRGGKPTFQCTRTPFTKEILDGLEAKGVRTILALDWFLIFYSQLEAFDQIILINPKYSELPNINTSELVYQITKGDTHARDISAIGSVADYLVEPCLEKFEAIAAEHTTLFPKLTAHLNAKTLTKYTAFDTEFALLQELFWAPYVVDGENANETLVNTYFAHHRVTLHELLDPLPKHAFAAFLRSYYDKYTTLLAGQWDYFHTHHKKIAPNFIFFEPKSEGRFTSKFASILSDTYRDSIIILKSFTTKDPRGAGWRYSLRRNKPPVDLGNVLQTLGVGGGHPEAGGIQLILENDVDEFEKKLMALITERLHAAHTKS